MKKCTCDIGVTCGSYQNIIDLPQPEWDSGHWAIDACISEELQQLWAYGIKTCGSCCGHHISSPYIQPLTLEDAILMKERSYVVVVLRNGMYCAKPKSIDWDLADWIRSQG